MRTTRYQSSQYLLSSRYIVRVMRSSALGLSLLSSNIIMSCAKSSRSSPQRQQNSCIHTSSEHPQIGGGAINEKERQYGKLDGSSSAIVTKLGNSNFNPEEVPSHLMHALFGLDRYPNYLSRWSSNVEDIDKLEGALEQQLAKVRQQKDQLLRRNTAIHNLIEEAKQAHEDVDWDVLVPPDSWKEIKDHVLDPVAWKAIINSKQFSSLRDGSYRRGDTVPSVQSVLGGEVMVQLDTAHLENWLDEECFDVYSFPLLSKAFCKRLKKVTKTIVDYSQSYAGRVNESESYALDGLGRRPIDMDSIGASWVNDLLFHLVIRPLSKELFQNTEKFKDLDWRQGYIAGYSNQPSEKKNAQRNRLIPHTDDSEVTLNVGFGDEDFIGGDLRFWNLRGTTEEGKHVGDFHPKMGHALLHSGRHLHEVIEVESGDRYAFIIWARSWGSTRATTCPCCWVNRRQEGSIQKVKNRCISSAQYN